MPKKIGTYEDKKTKVKSVALPIEFPDGSNGAVIITKLKKGEWSPTKEIKKITIEFND